MWGGVSVFDFNVKTRTSYPIYVAERSFGSENFDVFIPGRTVQQGMNRRRTARNDSSPIVRLNRFW